MRPNRKEWEVSAPVSTTATTMREESPFSLSNAAKMSIFVPDTPHESNGSLGRSGVPLSSTGPSDTTLSGSAYCTEDCVSR